MKTLAAVILFSASMVFPHAAFAGDANGKPVLLVGMEEHEMENAGRNELFFQDFIKAFGEKYNYQIKIVEHPVKRLFAEFVNLKLDIKYPDHPKWGEDARKGLNIVYSDPVVSYREGVLVLPENLGKGLDNLKRLSVIRGFSPWPYMDRVKSKSVTLVESSNDETAIRMTLLGRADGSYLSQAAADYTQNQLKLEKKLVFDTGLPNITDVYYVSTIKHPDVLKQINSFMKEEKAMIEKLKLKHGVQDVK